MYKYDAITETSFMTVKGEIMGKGWGSILVGWLKKLSSRKLSRNII